MNANPWWVLPGLSVMALSIFAGALVAVCFMNNDTLRTAMFTATITIASTAVNYFFGSSSGSVKKDETIAKMSKP